VNTAQGNIIQSVLDYARRGFSVIPIQHDKTPYISWKEYQTRKASSYEIEAWWEKIPNAMIGIVTGEISGLLVIDCDTQEGYDAIQGLIPDSLILPVARTPRGGWHLYFLFPQNCKLTVGTGIMPGVDFRGEGGYIIASPSINADGKSYKWEEGLALNEIEAPPLPDAIINIINNNAYKRDESSNPSSPYRTLQFLTEGRRDEDIFHAANCLIKGGCEIPYTEYIIDILAKNALPPFPQNEIKIKIQSALNRAEKRERKLAEEIRTWVTLQEGYFDLTNLKQTLQPLTPSEKRNVDVIIHRLKKDGLIEKYGNKAGVYRRIDKEFERVDFLTASGDEFQIDLPLEINELCKLYPGNITVVAGSKEAGKTALLMNIAKLSLGKRRIVYLNSEMGPDEFRNRLLHFDDIRLEQWAENMEVFNLKSNQIPADFIDGSETVWIADYLEIAEDFSKIALPIAGIHEKLGRGVAFIGLQKADGKEIGRGADFSREKARLYLSLDWDAEKKSNRIKIIDAKAWRGRNPRGLVRYYKLVQGADIIPQGMWE
jgi:hypothetical protein